MSGGDINERARRQAAYSVDRVLVEMGELPETVLAAYEDLTDNDHVSSNLFQWGDFIGHSGDLLHFKIECDALRWLDWVAAAALIAERVGPFSAVEGVPRGGVQLATALMCECLTPDDGPLLIVDDVWTTGASMEAHRAGRDAIGAVLFARNPVADWVTPVFQLMPARPPE